MVGGAYLNDWNLFCFLFFNIVVLLLPSHAVGGGVFFMFLWLLSFVIDPCTFVDLFGIVEYDFLSD
jgi:hypothetical protein